MKRSSKTATPHATTGTSSRRPIAPRIGYPVGTMLVLAAFTFVAWTLISPLSVKQNQASTNEIASSTGQFSAPRLDSDEPGNARSDTVTPSESTIPSDAAEPIRPQGKHRLPDFSKRDDRETKPSPTQLAALAALRQSLPGISVDFDPLTAAPSNIIASGEFLTNAPIAGNDINEVVREFIDENADLFGHGASALGQARITREDVTAHNGMRTTVWQQEVEGIPLHGTILKTNVTEDGALVALGSHFLQNPVAATGMDAEQRAALVAQPPVNVNQAIALAAANLGDQLAPAQAVPSSEAEGSERKQKFIVPLLSDTVVQLAWLPMSATSCRLCWDVTLMSLRQNEMFRVMVDASAGEVLMRTSLTNDISDASYRVYADGTTLQPFDSPAPMSPGLSTPASTQAATANRNLISMPALDTTASPNGWINDGGTDTYGNNVDSHLDLGNTNPAYGTGIHATSATRNFDFTMDLALEPSAYRDGTITQLFFLCNWYHDKMYTLGFTESSGNFQQNNFGRGGYGGDAVLAEAQDGGGTNNANFSTPADGSPGRMQMYIFTGPTPDRDGALDGEIVIHEFTHGLSNRLVGGGVGMSQLQSRGLGEGWSDLYPMCLLSHPDDDVNGNYASGAYATYQLGSLTENYYYGIRRYPYSTDMTKNPLTLKDIDPTQASTHAGIPRNPIIGSTANEVHNMGEVWCVTLWEARANLINKLGAEAGNQMILQLVTDGMKLAPANPTFLQARDAVIQADLVNNGGANKNELWQAFAKRGMGYSAYCPANSTTTALVEAFDMPDDVRVTPVTPIACSGNVGGPFTPDSATYTLTNNGTASLVWTASKLQPWTTLSATGGTLAPGASTTLTWSVNSGANTVNIGNYTDTLTITNVASNFSQHRTLSLTIIPHFGVPFVEDFEHAGSEPIGWTQEFVTSTATWTFQNGGENAHPANAHGGSYNALLYYGAASTHKTRLVTPMIDFGTNPQNAQLTFWHCMEYWSPDQDELAVYYKTSAGGTWTLLATYTSNVAEWTQRAISLPNPSSTYYIAFEGNAKYGYGVCLDDVEVTAAVTGTPTITTGSSLPSGTVGAAYSQTLVANGGTTPYVWSLTSGSLPAGLSLSGAGVISGTPTVASTAGFTVRVTDGDNLSSTRYFNLMIEISLSDALDQSGLVFTSSGNLPWVSQTATTHDGVDAARSGAITHSQSSAMQTTVTGPGMFSFWWKVSSESGWDYLTFYLDGVAQSGAISGTVDWQQKFYTVTTGSHTLEWVYSKDNSVNSGSDCGWVDQLTLPVPVVPIITVEQPVGAPIANGGLRDFGPVNLGANASLTFTVRNTGAADLTGLAVTLDSANIADGTNTADFTVGSLGATSLEPGASTAFTVTFAPGGTGSRTAAIRITSNTAATPFGINLTGIGVATPIQAWRQTYFGTTSNTGNAADTADPYHTGIPNLLVFAFLGPNQNPALAKASQLPQVRKIGDSLLVSFTEPAGVSGITYGAEWSQSLSPGSWTPVADAGNSSVSPPQHIFSVSIGAKPQLFMRLKVTNP